MITQQSIHIHTSIKYLSKVHNELLITVFIKATAEGFVGIFVPIFLLTHGLSLRAVFTYSLLVFVTTFFSILIALKCNQYLGMKKTMLVGILLTIGFYLSLHGLTSGINYKIIALVDGLALGFYYGAYNMLLTKSMKRGREGKGASVQQVVGIIAGVLGPTIGALLIKGLSFQSLFLIVSILLVTAPVPLFFGKEVKAKRELLHLSSLFTEKPTRVDRAIFLQGVMDGSGVFWPVYIYLHYPHLTALGILSTVTAALVITTTYLVGSSVDKKQRLAYRLGAVLYAPTWISRLLFLTPVGLGLNSLSASVLAIGPTMAVSKDIFHIAKTSKNQTAHFGRVEFYKNGGRACLIAIAILLPNLTAIFILTSLATLLYIGCAPKRKGHDKLLLRTAARLGT